MDHANKTAPGSRAPEATAKIEIIPEALGQTMLFDRADYIPEASSDEAGETYRRAVVLRDYLAKVGGGTFEGAIAAAGLPLPPPLPMRAFVVNCAAPKLAMRLGWAIPSGGIARAQLSRAGHGGRIGHYLRGPA